jgi:hypothetical protein
VLVFRDPHPLADVVTIRIKITPAIYYSASLSLSPCCLSWFVFLSVLATVRLASCIAGGDWCRRSYRDYMYLLTYYGQLSSLQIGTRFSVILGLTHASVQT